MCFVDVRARGRAALLLVLAALCACRPAREVGAPRDEEVAPADEVVAPRGPQEADRWLGVDRAATFADHVARLRATAVTSAAGFARLGTSWDDELAVVAGRYRDAVTADDAYLALVALQNSLHDGHAFLRVDEALVPQAPRVALPLSVRVERRPGEGRAHYVVRAGGAVAAGSEIVAVDGVTLARIERAHLTWFPGGSSPEALQLDVARWLAARDPRREPTPAAGTATTLLVRRDDGSEETQTLTWQERDDDGPGCPPFAERCAPDDDGDYAAAPTFEGLGACVYATDDPATRVVRYRTLLMPDSYNDDERACLQQKLPALSYDLTLDDADALGPRGLLQLDQGALLDHLARAGVERVLFDVRENTGGDFDPVFFGAFTSGRYAQPRKSFVYTPYFRDDPARIAAARPYVALLDGWPIDDGAARIEQHLRDHPDAATSPPIPFYCQSPACADGEEFLTSQSNIVFRAVVLTGPRCFSACDDFVAILRDNDIAPTLGEPTGAGDSPYGFDVLLPLHNGATAALHVTVGVSHHPGTQIPLEGHPTLPDVPLPPTRENRGRYVEAALAAAPW
jgi:hypothetical protein